jgi:hypothetical protein
LLTITDFYQIAEWLHGGRFLERTKAIIVFSALSYFSNHLIIRGFEFCCRCSNHFQDFICLVETVAGPASHFPNNPGFHKFLDLP